MDKLDIVLIPVGVGTLAHLALGAVVGAVVGPGHRRRGLDDDA